MEKNVTNFNSFITEAKKMPIDVKLNYGINTLDKELLIRNFNVFRLDYRDICVMEEMGNYYVIKTKLFTIKLLRHGYIMTVELKVKGGLRV